MTKEESSNSSLLKFVRENISIILLILYSISFINYYFFYSFFDIPIFNYVGLNDLLFYSIEYIFSIILTVFFVEVFLFIFFSILYGFYMNVILLLVKKKYRLVIEGRFDKRIRKRTRRIFEDKFSDSLFDFKISLFFLSIFIVFFFPIKEITIPAWFIYMFYLLDRGQEERISKLSIFASLVVILISLGINTGLSIYQKRYNKQEYDISFKQGEDRITTNSGQSNLNYLGETSTNIFLYNIEKNETKIYSKDNISDLTIKSSSTFDEYLSEFLKSNLYREIRKFLKR